MNNDLMADVKVTPDYVLFWGGWPSQWHPCRFEIGGVTYNCCEQYMMAEKARVFGDGESMAAVLASKSPREQKALGRKVAGFDAEVWNKVCRGVVYTANLAKFSQNEELKSVLLATGTKTIVEASPTDKIWGIGLKKDDPRAIDPSKWLGKNWLGVVLMHVRATLTGRPPDPELAAQLAARKEL